jgi:asparagine synthase (glutamine-hydrolysing)
MCGIVGARTDWLAARGLDPARAIAEALAALRPRGPDGEGQHRAGPWQLGCARLAITQPRSHQPVALRGGRYVGVLNGNVADAGEQWPRLRPRAARRAPLPNDAWLPLLAVAAGHAGDAAAAAAALAALRGHHAYAVADAATGALVFGQDHFGEKPLWCVVEPRPGDTPRLVAFASTPAALRALGLPLRWHRRRLAEWFRRGWQHDAPLRLTAALRLVGVPQRGVPLTTAAVEFGWCGRWGGRDGEAARQLVHTGAVDADVHAPAPHRTPTRHSTNIPRAAPSPHAATALRAAVVASVARSSAATVPVALALSGGVDSSCLALALRAAGRTVPAYQLRADGSDGRERAAAAAVAQACGLPLRPVDVGPEALLVLPQLIAAAGAPLGDPSILAVHALCAAVAADGGKVLLGGEGADELFLGYRRYRALRSLPRLPWLRPLAPRWANGYPARWLRAAVADDPAAALLAVTPPGFADLVLADDLGRRRVWRDAGERTPASWRAADPRAPRMVDPQAPRAAASPAGGARAARAAAAAATTTDNAAAADRANFACDRARADGAPHPAASVRGPANGVPHPADPVLAARAADLDGYLRCDLLPKVDVAGLAAGVETRCPFLDRDVAALALADDWTGLGKASLRRAFPDLPGAVLRLPKRGFALPLDRWFRGELPWLDLLAEARTRQRPHLRPGGVAAAVDRHRRGAANLGHGLFLLVAAELHLRWLAGEVRPATESPPRRA